MCPVFLSADIRKTVQFYIEKLDFQSAKHYDKVENFATLYRDEIEFVIVQARQGEVLSNAQRYGAGYDACIDTATPEGIEPIYEEFKAKDEYPKQTLTILNESLKIRSLCIGLNFSSLPITCIKE